MIGQHKLLQQVDKLLEQLPTFIIICGPKGSGKKTIAKYICDNTNMLMYPSELKIDSVRDTIDVAYTQTEPICYLFADADDMSIGAKNCLLKITEEPPQKAHFIMTLTSISTTLDTIKSRGTVLQLDEYSTDELIEYRKLQNYKSDYDDLIRLFCTCTGEVDELISCDADSFYTFAKNIVDYIHIPTTGNIFKISKQIKTKADDKGFDGILLMKAIRTLYMKKALDTNDKKCLLAALKCSEALIDLKLPSLSKVATYDKWIMDVRKVLV